MGPCRYIESGWCLLIFAVLVVHGAFFIESWYACASDGRENDGACEAMKAGYYGPRALGSSFGQRLTESKIWRRTSSRSYPKTSHPRQVDAASTGAELDNKASLRSFEIRSSNATGMGTQGDHEGIFLGSGDDRSGLDGGLPGNCL